MNDPAPPAGSDMLLAALRTFRQRPIWVNGLLLFCAYMAIVYLPWDIFIKPVAQDQEVWFGYRFEGWMAKLTAVPHWCVYAAGTWGFWKMSPRVWFWSALYTAQIAVSMFVWPLLYRPDEGYLTYLTGSIAAAPFLALALWLWRARGRYPPLARAERAPAEVEGERPGP